MVFNCADGKQAAGTAPVEGEDQPHITFMANVRTPAAVSLPYHCRFLGLGYAINIILM